MDESESGIRRAVGACFRRRGDLQGLTVVDVPAGTGYTSRLPPTPARAVRLAEGGDRYCGDARLDLNPTVLFGKHLFAELRRR